MAFCLHFLNLARCAGEALLDTPASLRVWNSDIFLVMLCFSRNFCPQTFCGDKCFFLAKPQTERKWEMCAALYCTKSTWSATCVDILGLRFFCSCLQRSCFTVIWPETTWLAQNVSVTRCFVERSQKGVFGFFLWGTLLSFSHHLRLRVLKCNATSSLDLCHSFLHSGICFGKM